MIPVIWVLVALQGVYDSEIPVDVVNLGLVYDVAVNAGWVTVRMTTTFKGLQEADGQLTEPVSPRAPGGRAAR